MERYYLMHITTESNMKSIIKEKKFNEGVHREGTNEWLGDGVYFWNGNDKNMITRGIKIASHKRKRNEKIAEIEFILEVNSNNYLDLDDLKTGELFKTFIEKEIQPKHPEIDLLKKLEVFSYSQNLNPKEQNEVGKMFGLCLNKYCDELKKNGFTINLVSFSFYNSRKIRPLFYNSEERNQQYCVKAYDIFSNIIKKSFFCKIFNNDKGDDWYEFKEYEL